MTRTKHKTALVWFRRDLRLADNPALAHAAREAGQVVPVYIHEDDSEHRDWPPGAATLWWLHHSLTSLSAQLEKTGSPLILRSGASQKTLQALIRETGATLVCWNRLYEPALIARDKQIKTTLRESGIEAESFNGALLFEPWAVQTGSGTPYRVFTPFWRNCARELDTLPAPLPAPRRLHPSSATLKSGTIAELKLLPHIPWDTGMNAAWKPGAPNAIKQLQRFTEETAADYSEGRNRPDKAGTSRLSPYLHFGELSARQVLAALNDRAHGRDAAARRGAEAWIRQIGWRDFAHHLLYHYPHTTNKPLDERFERYAWRKDRAALKAWQRGRTGYPLVDAGMRELWTTGWMHNRVRMCVASFLTKNLRIHWLEGARWFWDTLLDADLPNNTLGWQWTAGCGADAAPYYRVFNPTLQAEKFDPTRAYIRRWIPEIAQLPDRWIHRPWEAPEAELRAAGINLGRTYPRPIVDLKLSREEALEGYESMKTAENAAGK